ncbi:MAG: hypothetical protein KDB07_07045, partial [Planctomycetes bacterium]|nr:hypothetical protein [Planctomycetota bacterium]
MFASAVGAQTYSSAPHLSSCCDIGIKNVTLGSINNTTGAGTTPQYNFYASQTTTLNVGATYQISISRGTYTTMAHVAYMDWNKDGDFTDAGETLYTYAQNPGATASYSFTVPASALGGTTRLRVRSHYYPFAPAMSPTAQLRYGDTEDYDVTVVAADPELSAS